MYALGGSSLYKKVVLLTILICTLSTTGCVVINNGKDDTDTSNENSTTNKTTKEVIIQRDNSSSNSSNSSNNSSSNRYSGAYKVDGYIFYDSDSRYLTSSDLSGLSSWELKLARNEIYARHGRLFKDSSIQGYFNSCNWYYGYISPDNFDDDVLNSVEVYNVKLIKKYE